MRQISLRIHTDGKIEAETHGVKGKACLDYIRIVEQLTGARTVDSGFTGEYYEGEAQMAAEAAEEVNA
jgi:hypothetical protein